MSIGLTRKEYDALFARPGRETYPKPTLAALEELKVRGYAVTEPRLNYMIRQHLLSPPHMGGRKRHWRKSDIDMAAQVFEDAEDLSPMGCMCLVLQITMATWFRARNKAWKALRKKYPGQVRGKARPDWFIQKYSPPNRKHGATVEFIPDPEIIETLNQKMEKQA